MLGAIAQPGFSSVHVTLNAGKESIGLDLASLEGRKLLERLVPRADVLIHNFRPGVMERLGLGNEQLQILRVDLIIARISGFGQAGPLSSERAYDPIVQAESGMTVRDAAGEPRLAPQYICDKTAGLYAAQAVTAALFARSRDGRGRVVDISMIEAAVGFGWIDLHAPQAFPDGAKPAPNIAAVYRPWRTLDGWIVVVILSEAEFRGWAEAINAPDVLDDKRFGDMASRFLNWDALRAQCSSKLGSLTTVEALQRLRAAGVPCGAANQSADLLDHDQLQFEGFIQTVHHPRIGRTTRVKPVARFDDTREAIDSHAPAIGEQTCSVLSELGLGADEIGAALASGAAHEGASR